jgi:hypothetical protein
LNSSKRQEHASLSKAQQSFLNEIEVIEYSRNASVSSLLSRKVEIQVASLDLEAKQSQLAKFSKREVAIREHIDNLKGLTAGKERDMKKMESFASITARQLVEADKDVAKLKLVIFKESQALNALCQEEKNLTAEIRSTQVRVFMSPVPIFGLLPSIDLVALH